MSALKKGDLVLITGGKGWVGSHVVDKALEHGLSLRLAIRNQSKADRLIEGMKKTHGQDIKIETIIIEDMCQDDAYDEAVKDVQGIVHVAAHLELEEVAGDVDDCLKKAVKNYESILNAAHNTSGIRRLVVTSSSITLGMPKYEGDPIALGPKSWWHDVIDEAHKAPNPIKTYAACKVATEQLVWSFLHERAPKFVINSVLPSMCMGRPVPGTDYSSTSELVRKVLLQNQFELLNFARSIVHVDVDDVAILHVLALMEDDVRNERLLGIGESYSWLSLFELATQILPISTQSNALPGIVRLKDINVYDTSRAQQLLAPYGGSKSLEYSLRRNLEA